MNDDIYHGHVYLGRDHARSEQRTWRVIILCSVMMVIEIAGGLWFGSIALVADGLHMSTHAGALLLAALAYSFARKHAQDPRFSFGTGKLGDLAGFTSAIILAMISLFIAYEAVIRLFVPEHIHFAEAIPIACLGLAVNIASAWLLGGGGEGHGHAGHSHAGHEHGHDHAGVDGGRLVATSAGNLRLEVFERDAPPRFRLYADTAALPAAATTSIETLRPDGARQSFAMENRGYYLESGETIPEPHEFTATLCTGTETNSMGFSEAGHEHAAAAAHKTGRDNNMRAAVVHVIADAAVSVLVIIALVLAKLFNWVWMDPVAGLVGAGVIASWALGLIRDTGGILLDMTPDRAMEQKLREAIETDGDRLADLHLWRLGPGHLGAIICVGTAHARDVDYYRTKLARFRALSHLTVEVRQA